MEVDLVFVKIVLIMKVIAYRTLFLSDRDECLTTNASVSLHPKCSFLVLLLLAGNNYVSSGSLCLDGKYHWVFGVLVSFLSVSKCMHLPFSIA